MVPIRSALVSSGGGGSAGNGGGGGGGGGQALGHSSRSTTLVRAVPLPVREVLMVGVGWVVGGWLVGGGIRCHGGHFWKCAFLHSKSECFWLREFALSCTGELGRIC